MKKSTCNPGHKSPRKSRLSMATTCIPVLILVSFLLCLTPITQVKASYGSAQVDGSKDSGYTLIVNGSQVNSSFDTYQMNDNGYYWFYFESTGNFTFQNFTWNKSNLELFIWENSQLEGIYECAFETSRFALELKLIGYLITGSFNFQINGENYSYSINSYPEPPEPPEYDYEYGLTEFMQGLVDLAFANGWFSVFFWVIVIVWFWRSMTRKIWILRKENSLRGKDYGRWIKEELVNIKGATDMRLWRHKFKTDAAKTATVEFVYCKYNKEEILAKTKFKRINGFWLALPYIRVGKLRLRPDQYFKEPVLSKSLGNWIKRIFYYLVCWIPKLNDEMYKALTWVDSNKVVKEIPYLYINYAEDRIIELIECTFDEKIFDAKLQKEIWKSRKQKLTKEEVVLIEEKANIKNFSKGETFLEIRPFANVDEALQDKFSREELMAIHRYKESIMDNKIKLLNQRLENTIETLQNERRERVEEIQTLLDKMAEHTDFLNQNLGTYIAKASGLKQLGLGSQDVLQTVLKEAMVDFIKHSDKIKKKDEMDKEDHIKNLEEQLKQAKIDLAKKTPNDLNLGEIEVEFQDDHE